MSTYREPSSASVPDFRSIGVMVPYKTASKFDKINIAELGLTSPWNKPRTLLANSDSMAASNKCLSQKYLLGAINV